MKVWIEREYPRLYKYMNSKWIDASLRRGIFRIGTLYEYRHYEHKEIRDEGEGLKSWILPDSVGERPEALKRLLESKPYLSQQNVHSALVEHLSGEYPVAIMEESPDCYMYCVTDSFNEDLMRQFGYDSCIEISSPTRFLKVLSKAMLRKAKFAALRPCRYAQRNDYINTHHNVMPAVLKSPEFAHQKEVRLVWDPRGPKQVSTDSAVLQPELLKCLPATSFLRRIV